MQAAADVDVEASDEGPAWYFGLELLGDAVFDGGTAAVRAGVGQGHVDDLVRALRGRGPMCRPAVAGSGLSAGRLGGGGAIPRLVRIVGPARAGELVLLERVVDARTALQWGLVSRVVPRARLEHEAGRVARHLANRAPLALALAKEAVTRALDLTLDDGCRLEHDCYVLLQTTADRREGIAAFLGKRPPQFAGH